MGQYGTNGTDFIILTQEKILSRYISIYDIPYTSTYKIFRFISVFPIHLSASSLSSCRFQKELHYFILRLSLRHLRKWAHENEDMRERAGVLRLLYKVILISMEADKSTQYLKFK